MTRCWPRSLPLAAATLALVLAAGCATTTPTAGDGHTPADAGHAAATVPARPPADLVHSPVPTAPPEQTAQPAPPPAPLIPDGPLQRLEPASVQGLVVAQNDAPPDLWTRIRRGFAMPDLHGELVQQHERWWSARPDYMQRMTQRSSKYLFHIVEELELRGMPTELALLPYIESAFNPQAVSSARAAGMWQFIPSTGRYFDLKQNAFRDDRRDVLASTRAALDYLQKLHQMFGDWHLALAAYNWGEGSVGRAIARNQREGLGVGYTDLRMPQETRHYVPKLQAVKNIVADPQAFRTELPFIANHPFFQVVDITRDIDVALAARLADVQPEDFRALNPSLNRPVILAAGTPQILLPWDHAEVFKRNLSAHDRGQLASWTVWTAPSHMSVAQAAAQVGMSEAQLRQVNGIPPRMSIRAGSALLVPRPPEKAGRDVPEHLADNGQVTLAPEGNARRAVVRARAGDTLAAVARRHRVAVSMVADWNQLPPNAGLRAGQEIVLFLPARPAGARPAARQAPRAGDRPNAAAAARRREAPPAKRPQATLPTRPSAPAKPSR